MDALRGGRRHARATVLLYLSLARTRSLALTPPYKSTPRRDDDFQSNQPTDEQRAVGQRHGPVKGVSRMSANRFRSHHGIN